MADPRTRPAIADDYRAARDRGDTPAMRRYQNEEACFVLLAILERLAADESSFVHGIALKGGVLMAGELRSPVRVAASIPVPTGARRQVCEPGEVGLPGGGRAAKTFRLREGVFGIDLV